MTLETSNLEKKISSRSLDMLHLDTGLAAAGNHLLSENSERDFIEARHELEQLLIEYRVIVERMVRLTGAMVKLSDEEYIITPTIFSTMKNDNGGENRSGGENRRNKSGELYEGEYGSLPLASLDRSNSVPSMLSLSNSRETAVMKTYDILRQCMLLNLNAKTILKVENLVGGGGNHANRRRRKSKTIALIGGDNDEESGENVDDSEQNGASKLKFELEQMHFNVLTVLNRLVCLRSEYAERMVVHHKMVGPLFNTLIRSSSNSLKSLASDILCHLSDRESTHETLVEWVTTFRFLVESDNCLSMQTAAYMITRMFCNKNMREMLSHTEFLPYTNMLEDIFHRTKDKRTKMYASFGVFLSKGKTSQQKFLMEKERNEMILYRLGQVAFVMGTAFTWAVLRIRLKRLPLAPNYHVIGKSTMVSSVLGSSFILRDEWKDRAWKRAHELFHLNPKDSSIHVPHVSLIHSSVVALLQLWATTRGIPFLLAPYLLHAMFFELQPKGSTTHPYQMYWEHMVMRVNDMVTRQILS